MSGVNNDEINAVEETVEVDYVGSDGVLSVKSEVDGSNLGIRNINEAEGQLQTLFVALDRERQITGASGTSFDEQRNKAVYILNNDIVSRDLEESDMDTIPWANVSGVSAMDKINDIRDMVGVLVDFYLANADVIEVPKVLEEG